MTFLLAVLLSLLWKLICLTKCLVERTRGNSPPQESNHERASASQASGPGAGRWHNGFCFAETPLWSLLCLDEEPPEQVGADELGPAALPVLGSVAL